MKPILNIPDFMPLSAEQRAWLQGYYAGMAMQAESKISVKRARLARPGQFGVPARLTETNGFGPVLRQWSR